MIVFSSRNIRIFQLITIALLFCTHVEANQKAIRVLASDSQISHTIETRQIDDQDYFSLTQWAESIDAVLDWDFVTGVAEMRFRDNRLRWVDAGKGIWINNRMQSMPGPALQRDGDFWIPMKTLDDLTDPLWEGDLTWDSGQRLLRRLMDRSTGDSATDLSEGNQVVIVLDAGHGGSDFGCIASDGQREKDITLKIMSRLSEILSNRLGVHVVVTRPGDYVVSVEERLSEANRAKADLFVALHVAPGRDLNGHLFVIHYLPELQLEKPDSTLVSWEYRSAETIADTSTFAAAFAEGMASSGSSRSFDVRQSDLYLLKGLSMPALLVELSWDSAFYGDIGVLTDGGCNRTAEAMFDGIRSILSEGSE